MHEQTAYQAGLQDIKWQPFQAPDILFLPDIRRFGNGWHQYELPGKMPEEGRLRESG